MKQVQVDLTFYHTRISNRGWATRRLRELMSMVRVCATVANPFGGQMIMDVACHPGYDNTMATIYVEDFTDEQIQEFVNALNRQRGVSAKIIRNVEHANA